MPKSHNRQQYNHGLINGSAAAATLKAMRPGRPIRVTGIGVIVETAYVAASATQSCLTIGVSALGSSTDVVKETLDLTAGITASTHVYMDMEELDTAFNAQSGQVVSFKTADTNSGTGVAGTFEPYFVYHEQGWKRNATYDVKYT